jgi:hypothetical protein
MAGPKGRSSWMAILSNYNEMNESLILEGASRHHTPELSPVGNAYGVIPNVRYAPPPAILVRSGRSVSHSTRTYKTLATERSAEDRHEVPLAFRLLFYSLTAL